MKRPGNILVAFAFLALCQVAVHAAHASGDPPVTPQTIGDARAETRILTSFILNTHLRDSDVHVAVNGGVATLGGTVDDTISKELAGQIAKETEGVGSVQNRISVDPQYTPRERMAGGVRSFGQKVDDATMTAKVKSKLLWSGRTDGLDIHVESVAGRVVLSGTVSTVAEKEAAGSIARGTDGVSLLTNDLRVAHSGPATRPGTSGAVSPIGANEDASDSWITAKVKSSLMFTRGVDIFGVEVSTLDGVVSLKGAVPNDSERALMIEVTGDVRGVRKVDASGLKIG